MSAPIDVLCAGIVVADHVCTPVSHVPAAGELVMADGMLLTIGGCAANAAVDLARMGVHAAVVHGVLLTAPRKPGTIPRDGPSGRPGVEAGGIVHETAGGA